MYQRVKNNRGKVEECFFKKAKRIEMHIHQIRLVALTTDMKHS
jgi:hypothetical protein